MKNCRDCDHVVSEQAVSCPQCGAPRPALETWDGRGFEYKSRLQVLGVPFLHISFKYQPSGRPVVARGIISIGQFGIGFVNISQFGIGFIGLGQFTIAGYALSQFALSWSCIAQIGLYIDKGYGQIVYRITDLLGRF